MIMHTIQWFKEQETLTHTALLAPTEQRIEESGENAQAYTQFWCPLNTFIIFPKKKDTPVKIQSTRQIPPEKLSQFAFAFIKFDTIFPKNILESQSMQ